MNVRGGGITPAVHITLPAGGWRPPALPGFVTDPRPEAPGPLDHLGRIGRAAELAGLDGVLVPFDPAGQDTFVVAAGLLRRSRHVRVAAGFHAGIATPVYAAKLSASLQRFSGDRLDWRLTVDLDTRTARSQGDFLEGPDRYARAEEFLTVAKGVWHEGEFTFEGRFYQVLGGGLPFPLSGRVFPRVHLSGTSPEAVALSARHADVHVFSPDDDIESLIDRLPGVAYGLRLPVLAREDDGEARTAAGRIGFSGLTGSYEAVADAIRGYARRGVSEFFVETAPHVEETYRLGEHLLPLLAKETHHVG
ncbi:LLM class flavin-dependent oxidoreductase [Microbispora sp. NPDC046933]|uniref:LLM class flavin-dependent oxidoreductase n=1 Tax=Microbispora sp. NPDC046933 TaxID=3155618 RepID=UPI0033FD221D